MWILPVHCFFFLCQLNNPSSSKKIGNVDKPYLRSDGCAAQLSPFYFSSIGCFHIDNITEWQFQERTLSVIDGVRETIWGKVIIQVKSGWLSTKAIKKFSESVSKLLAKIDSLYLSTDMMLEEPIYVKDLQEWDTFFNFPELSSDAELFLRRDYQVSNQTVCGVVESERNGNKYSHCGVNYVNYTDQEWLQCPSCLQWHYESCFEKER